MQEKTLQEAVLEWMKWPAVCTLTIHAANECDVDTEMSVWPSSQDNKAEEQFGTMVMSGSQAAHRNSML